MQFEISGIGLCPPIESPVCVLLLGNGDQFALVDASDFRSVSKYKWHISGYGYASHKILKVPGEKYKKRGELLHRLLLHASADQEVDHRNLDRLDCRRSNLRICTYSQNRMNVAKFKGVHTSQFKGVSWHKQSGKWQARICLNKKLRALGTFINEIDAAKAYDIAAKSNFGDFARTNFTC